MGEDVVIRLFGQFTVSIGSREISLSDFDRRSGAELVQFMASSPGRCLMRDQVLEAMWPHADLDSAKNSFYKAASYARKALGNRHAIVVRGEQVLLFPDADVRVDLEVVESADAATPSSVDAAIAIYRQEFLPTALYEDWSFSTRDRLHRTLLAALVDLGRWSEVLELDPTHEAASVAVMRRALLAGDRQAALRQFDILEQHLRLELGVEPSAAALGLRDRASDVTNAVSDAGTLRIAGSVEPPAKALVGRDNVMAALDERLVPGALVTLVGPAGAGKTHLADHAAATYGARFDHGVFVVSLSSVRDQRSVGQAILDGLDQPRTLGADADETVQEVLGRTSALVVLDNCEHVLETVARLLRPAATASAEVTILATSRQRLGLPGEQLVSIEGLEPGASTDLFVARANEQGVALDAQTQIVREVCERLDHLPLALELASAQVRVLGIGALVELLDDRLRLLEAANDVDPHHRTLERAIASSFDDLDQPVQATLCHFSQFAGTFDLRAATALARVAVDLDEIDAVRHVIELAEKSLLAVEEGLDGTRYRLLESIRLFAAARVDNQSEVQRAHLQYFAIAARQLNERCASPEFELAWRQLGADWANYRAAVGYGLDQGLLDDTMLLLTSTVEYAAISHSFEHQEWAERVLEVADDQVNDLVPLVRAGLAHMFSFQGRHADVAVLARSAGDPNDNFAIALAHFWDHWGHGRHDRAEQLLEVLDDHVRGTAGISELVVLSLRITLATFVRGDVGDADERTIRITKESGPVARTFELYRRARAALRAGDHEDVLRLCHEVTNAARSAGLRTYEGAASLTRAAVLETLDNPAEVAREIRHGLTHAVSTSYWTALRPEAAVAAKALAESGMTEAAAQIVGGCERQSYRGHGAAVVDKLTAMLREDLGDRFQALFDAGFSWSDSDLATFAIDQLTALLGEQVET